ncbi:hypothetical protein [Streptomyces sp. NPDC001401]|uniref:hypothetical protein n=1 Tax=Streptomyces sp. NPDC001401 TaxID=3364570 RepID=UPI00367FAD57
MIVFPCPSTGGGRQEVVMNTHARRGCTTAALAFLLTAGSGSGIAFADTGATVTQDTELAGIANSSSLTTPVVAQGTVDNADGTPAADTNVILYAWPNNDTEATLQEGDSVKLQPVARAVTDSSGAYALRMASLSSLAPQTANDGTVNLEIFARSGSKMVVSNFARKVVGSSSSAFLANSTSSDSTASLEDATTLQASAETNTLTLDADASTPTEDGATATATEDPSITPSPVTDAGSVTADDEATADTGVSKGCVTQLKKKLGAQWAIVGQTYSSTTGVDHKLVYTDGASSSLGIGVSASGKFGSYKRGGTNSKSSTSTTRYPTFGNHAGVYYKTKFQYGKYLVTCTSADSGSWHQTQHYEVRAMSYAGGATHSSASIPTATHCYAYEKGSTFTKKRSNAVTWTNGASLSDIIGVDLSAETGYTSDATVSYKFNATRHLCGTGGDPGGTHPYDFVAKN